MKATFHHISPILVVLLLFVLLVSQAHGQDWTRVVDLRGQWKFELGNDKRFADTKLDDEKEWSDIFVPSPWENEGFSGYDGYAWYRKHVTIPAGFKSNALYLHLGRVDDVDEVYFNGVLIGFSGSFPPNYFTAYSAERIYRIPVGLIKYGGDNVIAVRVYDQFQEGGIVSGSIGIYTRSNALEPDLYLEGIWKFRPGEDWSWKNPGYDDSKWSDITVPADWETQGFKDYDGIGWYRLRIRIPAALARQDLVFLGGRIDDVDEVYINGRKIGGTGRFGVQNQRETHRDLRVYSVPATLLIPDAENIIAIRVQDRFLNGGITDGPIGFISRAGWRDWSRHHPSKENNRETPRSIFDRLFGN